MTLRISYGIDPHDLRGIAERYQLTARQFSAAVRGAVNDAAIKARDKIREEVAAYITLPVSSITPRIVVVKRASNSDPTAVLKLDSRSAGNNARPTLMSFAGSPSVPRREAKRTGKGNLTKKGRQAFETFSYQITKTGGRRILPGGFVQRATRRHNLQTGAIDRLSEPTRPQAFIRTGPKRYPLAVPRGPSIAAIWQSESNAIDERAIRDTSLVLAARMRERAGELLESVYKKAA